MISKEDIFPWMIKDETIEQRYLRLKKICPDITLQEVSKMDQQLRKEIDYFAYKLTEPLIIKKDHVK